MLQYALPVLSVGAAVLLTQGLQLLGVADPRPALALLVAVAISALYGGLGPGIVALGLAALVSQDVGFLVAGALLAAVCAGFRRGPVSDRPALGSGDRETALSEGPAGRAEKPDAAAATFSTETTRFTPPFTEGTTATWRFHHEQPLDITLPEDDQVEHLYLYSVLAECNDAFARMYGFRSALEVIGTRLVVFLPPSNPENIAYLRTFIRRGYRLEDAESREIDRYGNAKCFVNNLVGIFERGQLVGAWGTQRDVTGRESEARQVNRSWIHSSKSSSQ